MRKAECAAANKLVPAKEHVLHIAVAKLLKDHCLPDWRYTHVASGEHRDIRTAVKLKAMGTKRGWPDLILISPQGVLHGLELKRKGEDLTDDQKLFMSWANVQSIPYAIAWTMDGALRILDAWGCLRIRLGSAAP